MPYSAILSLRTSNKVVFDRDLLITHMVSPEGEQLQLIEPIDPKGQNVEAWMLELEGNMRLTVIEALLVVYLPPLSDFAIYTISVVHPPSLRLLHVYNKTI